MTRPTRIERPPAPAGMPCVIGPMEPAPFWPSMSLACALYYVLRSPSQIGRDAALQRVTSTQRGVRNPTQPRRLRSGPADRTADSPIWHPDRTVRGSPCHPGSDDTQSQRCHPDQPSAEPPGRHGRQLSVGEGRHDPRRNNQRHSGEDEQRASHGCLEIAADHAGHERQSDSDRECVGHPGRVGHRDEEDFRKIEQCRPHADYADAARGQAEHNPKQKYADRIAPPMNLVRPLPSSPRRTSRPLPTQGDAARALRRN